MLILALLLAAQEGDRFVVPDELLDGGLERTEDEQPASAVPS